MRRQYPKVTRLPMWRSHSMHSMTARTVETASVCITWDVCFAPLHNCNGLVRSHGMTAPQESVCHEVVWVKVIRSHIGGLVTFGYWRRSPVGAPRCISRVIQNWFG